MFALKVKRGRIRVVLSEVVRMNVNSSWMLRLRVENCREQFLAGGRTGWLLMDPLGLYLRIKVSRVFLIRGNSKILANKIEY